MQDFEQIVRGWHWKAIRYFERVGSTNDEALKWLDEGAPDLAVVIANEQTQGRGRSNRHWYTLPNAALAFSVILKDIPQEDPSTHDILSRLTALGALAVCQALKSQHLLEAEIKWPNDVLVMGKKIAGVLVEGRWMGDNLAGAIIGIGINIAHSSIPPNQSLVFPPTCLEDCIQTRLDGILNQVRANILHAVVEELTQLRLCLSAKEFIQQWEARLAYKNQWVQLYVDYPGNQRQSNQLIAEGKLVGLTPSGALTLQDSRGNLVTMAMGDIRVRTSPL